MYGLAAEHTLRDIVLWSGERGASYFFQAELPYDVRSYPYSGYTVASHVQAHESYGAGVYHFFRDYNVTVQSGISAPTALELTFHSPLTVFLNGKGTILNVLNDKGNRTTKPALPGAMTAYICPTKCELALGATCTTDRVRSHSPFKTVSCSVCAGRHQRVLKLAGCGPTDIAAYCASDSQPAATLESPGSASRKTKEPTVRSLNGNATCRVGDSVLCPGQKAGGPQCAGNSCCADGVTCPSAEPGFQCCPRPKVINCLNASTAY
jgi:hypothetical protein